MGQLKEHAGPLVSNVRPKISQCCINGELIACEYVYVN